MAKIVYEDGTEKDFNEEDFISKEEVSEKYVSKEEVESNYVSKEKYDQKKKQTKEAFKQLDLAKKEGVEVDKEAMANQIREEITSQQNTDLRKFRKKSKQWKRSILICHGNKLTRFLITNKKQKP